MSNGSGTQRRPIPGFGWLPESIQDFEQPLPGAEWLRDQVRPGSVMDPWAEKQARDFLRALVPQDVHDMALEGLVGMIAGPVIGKAGRAVSRKFNPPFDASRRAFGRDTGGGDLLEQVQTRDAMLGDWAEESARKTWTNPDLIEGILTHSGRPMTPRNVADAERIAGSMGQSYYGGSSRFPRSRWYSTKPSGLSAKHFESWLGSSGGGKPASSTLRRSIDKSFDSLSTKPEHAGWLEEWFNVLNKRIGEEVLEETGEKVIKGSEGQITKDFLESLLRRFGVRK